MNRFYNVSNNINTNYVVAGIGFIVAVKLSRDLHVIRSYHNRQSPPSSNGHEIFKIRQMEDSWFLTCMFAIPISYGYTIWKYKNELNFGTKISLCGAGNLCLCLMFGAFWDTYCSRDYGPLEAVFVFFDFIISTSASAILYGVIKWRSETLKCNIQATKC
eukprot:6931_1